MSEQIEIEVGLNTSRFQQAIQSVHKSVQSLATRTSNIRVDGLRKSLEQVKDKTKEGSEESRTLAGAFKQLSQVKISNTALKALKEVLREVLRIVHELAPVMTLAMNAMDRQASNVAQSYRKMLTETERLNVNFLIMRKVLPVRFWREMKVNGDRVTSSIQGMSKEFMGLAKGSVGAIRSTVESLKSLYKTLSSANQQSVQFVNNLTGGEITKLSKDFKNISNSVNLYAKSLVRAVNETKLGNAVLGSTSVALGATKRGFTELINVSGQFISVTKKKYDLFLRVARGSSTLSGSLNLLARVASGVGVIAFKALTASVTLLGVALTRLSITGASQAIPVIAKTASVATRSVKALSSSILSIATAPIRAVSGAFGALIKSIGGSIGMITSVIGAVGTLGYALSNVAQGAVATFRKNWIKVLSEVPDASAKATDDMKADLKDLQAEVGILSKDALPSLQKALQLGFTSGNAIDLLRQSSNLAIAEITDLENAVNLVGNTMKVFASSNITAEQAVDKLYTASKVGGINLEELGSAVQRVAPNISRTGVSFDEFTSSLAVLVRSGRLTYSALQDIANITEAITNPSEKAQDMFNKLGVAFGKNALRGKGLSGVLAEIVRATDGNAQSVMQMLGGQENLNTAMRLGANNGNDFAQALEKIGGSAGNAKTQAEQIDTSFQRALRRARVTAEGLMVDLGELMSPAIKSINEFIKEYTAKIKRAVQIGMELFKSGDIGEFLKLSIQVGIGKAETMFVNFAQKAGAGLFAGLSEAMAQITRAVPILATALGAVWDAMKSAGLSAVGHMVEALGTMANVWQALLIKAIEEVKEVWSDFTGGSFQARELKTIVQQEIDESAIRELGKRFQLMGEEATSAGEVSAKQIYDTLVPAVKAVGQSVSEAYTNTANIASDSEDVVKAQQKLQSLIDKGAKALDDANKKTQDNKGQTAISGDLPTNEGNVGGNNASGFASSVGQIIASGLAQVGGGGNVQQTQVNLLSTLTTNARDQLAELKLQTKALENFSLGEVR